MRPRKLVRMLSGVTVVAVMCKPHPCPHGRCAYCPGGPEYSTPQSYIGNEPALMRALQCHFDPVAQVRVRLAQYEKLGYKPSKVELIIMGGTFLATSLDYQEWFVTRCLTALSYYPNPPPKRFMGLEEAQALNEVADVRCVGLTIETRPDWALEKHADRMLRLGATRVELGVQSIYDDVLEIVERGHRVADTIKATRILKDSGFKVVYHVMPGLPGSDYDRDLEMFRELFENPDYRPDMLKIYPTLVIKGTKLYDMWVRGDYEALSDYEALELIAEAYKYIPEYVRIMRVQRDVPAPIIEAGPRRGDLRVLVELRAMEKGVRIKEIRWREAGLASWRRLVATDASRVRIRRVEYEASRGVEVFISAVDEVSDTLVGFVRLRIPSEYAHRPEVDERTGLIRELHVYGWQVPVGEAPKSSWQHHGWGARLMEEAERVASEEYDVRRILVISGVGVRGYYRRLGYVRYTDTPYMIKRLY